MNYIDMLEDCFSEDLLFAVQEENKNNSKQMLHYAFLEEPNIEQAIDKIRIFLEDKGAAGDHINRQLYRVRKEVVRCYR